MPTDHRAALKNIRTFPALIRYLHDEMDWPITVADFEDLTFEYTPEELGIDAESAAKIVEIKRLRPLTSGQPWGVFFVKFEPKKLPVIALRRILSRVALKKRASANSSERTAWAMDDLLFISNYGEGDERQISFAHFSQPEAKADLPTLKVLGWDGLDTPLHLDAVADKLTHNLSWPDDPNDVEAWRARWQAAFSLRYREVITTSRDLSVHLAELARSIRDRIRAALAIETERGPLTKLMGAFREALVHDLDADGFADMYAQTIAYGLLSARIANPKGDTADELAAHMPVTNPFLKELMEAFLHVGGRKGKAGGPGIDFDELGVSEVVELLDNANMDAVVRDFGDQNPQEDPVIHFYELFLKEYDAKKRMQRGVFYTPRPVVSYIVRSVDELLRTEFGLEDGLADTTTWGEMVTRDGNLNVPEGTSPDQDFIQILDPACGTGTFLVEVIDVIHKTLVAKWIAQEQSAKRIDTLWNEYVPKHLLPRLHGYELLMAPYAIAHLKIGLKLYETGYHFGCGERTRIYLTNALEPTSEVGQMKLVGILPALAHEAQAVNEIKRNQRFTLIVGNPPYSGESANKLPWIEQSVKSAYQQIDGVPLVEKGKKNWLLDDYVKFIRLAHYEVARAGVGVIGYIINNAFQDNPTFRGLRHALVSDFSTLDILDLHGSGRRNDAARGTEPDKNVFEIMQGNCVLLLARAGTRSTNATVSRADVWGSREHKYTLLAGSSRSQITWARLAPKPPQWYFISLDLTNEHEWDSYLSLPDVLPINGNGLISAKDHFAYALTRAELESNLKTFLDPKRSDQEVAEVLGINDNSMWSLHEARLRLGREIAEANFCKVAYLPFDNRYSLFHRDVIFNLRRPISRHIVGGQNLVLLTTRMTKGAEWKHCFVTRNISDCRFLSNQTSTNAFVFPLLVAGESSGLFSDVKESSQLSPNFSPRFIAALKAAVSVVWSGPTAEKVLHYMYAVFHSPAYRIRYSEFLKLDYPRLPLPGQRGLFDALARLGSELVALHLLESPSLARFNTTYTGPKNPAVGRVGWSDDTVWLDAAATKKDQPTTPGTIGFRSVPEQVWNFHIGGYQVCEKWLKDRKGRILSGDDVVHYQKIVVALTETICLMQDIDDVIAQHGGWPSAFAGETEAVEGGATDSASESGVLPLTIAASPARVYELDALPLAKVAEPDAPHYGADRQNDLTPRSSVGDLDRDALICEVRHMFSDGADREREAAINSLAREMGFKRTGIRIHEELDNALRTAVRRGILTNQRGTLQLFLRSINEYDRDFLKDQFLASLDGRQWTERDEAVRQFARWMGFRRTGASIDTSVRSLMNGLIRESRLESDGSQIRRVG